MSPKAKELLNKIKNWFKREPDLRGEPLDEIEEEEILKSLDPDFEELLRFFGRRDKERYFKAGDERARLIIRGEYLRTLYLLRKIEKLKTLKVETKKPEESKIAGRYGV